MSAEHIQAKNVNPGDMIMPSIEDEPVLVTDVDVYGSYVMIQFLGREKVHNVTFPINSMFYVIRGKKLGT